MATSIAMIPAAVPTAAPATKPPTSRHPDCDTPGRSRGSHPRTPPACAQADAAPRRHGPPGPAVGAKGVPRTPPPWFPPLHLYL